jgi:hypothetical protein
MTGLVRNAMLLTAAGLFVASAAMAGVPSAANSKVLAVDPVDLVLKTTACISLVGSSAGVPDAGAGQFTVNVRDLANVPMNNASVVIDLIGSTDLVLCNDQLDLAATVNCTFKTTRKFTDALGNVNFVVLGGSNGAGNATTLAGGVKVYANGTLIATLSASAFDLDNGVGDQGVGANDLSAWVTDFGLALPFGRSDYDCDGAVGANDLSRWVTEFGLSTSTVSCAVSCP